MLGALIFIAIVLIILEIVGWIVFYEDAQAWRIIIKHLDKAKYEGFQEGERILGIYSEDKKVITIRVTRFNDFYAVDEVNDKFREIRYPGPYLFLSCALKRKIKKLVPPVSSSPSPGTKFENYLK